MKKYVVDNGKQSLFAMLSGDFNPLHMDEVFVRRTLFGKQVVHGIHLVFAALEMFALEKKIPFSITEIKARFENALGVTEPALISLNYKNSDEAEALFQTPGNLVLCRIAFKFKEEKPESPTEYRLKTSFVKKPDEPYDFNHENCKESLVYDPELLERIFPNVSLRLSPFNIAVLLASTRIVGMKYPGMHSIFNALVLTFPAGEKQENELTYDVRTKSSSMNMLSISFTGKNQSVSGQLSAFIRPRPVEAAKISELTDMVTVDEFAGQRALVIGGTRGIGLQCLRLLALGGAKTMFTYCKNEEDAVKVSAELKENKFQTSFIQADITALSADAVSAIKKFAPTHLYYFSTPRIMQRSGSISEKIFDEYCKYYVFALDELINHIGVSLESGGVFYPSSTFVEELPAGMLEYAMAKYAAELFAKYVNLRRKIKIYAPRFPKVETDQTVGLIPVKLTKPETILKDELQRFVDFTKNKP